MTQLVVIVIEWKVLKQILEWNLVMSRNYKLYNDLLILPVAALKSKDLLVVDISTKKNYEDARMSMAELENDQLDLVILSQINVHHFSGRLAEHRTETEKSLRVKQYTNFLYKSHSIYLKTFLFLHGIGKKRFRNLMKHYQLNGVTVRTHEIFVIFLGMLPHLLTRKELYFYQEFC